MIQILINNSTIWWINIWIIHSININVWSCSNSFSPETWTVQHGCHWIIHIWIFSTTANSFCFPPAKWSLSVWRAHHQHSGGYSTAIWPDSVWGWRALWCCSSDKFRGTFWVFWWRQSGWRWTVWQARWRWRTVWTGGETDGPLLHLHPYGAVDRGGESCLPCA